jgi:iron complex outermembrane receptor protein
VAGRVDHYSDFGTTVNPNFGITWHPFSPVKFRSTFGTSFVAPELSALNPVPYEVAAESVPDPTTGGLSNVLQVYGGNSHLRPETADVITAGLDFASGGFRASVTFYHTEFQHLILTIQEAGINPSAALDLESDLGPSIVQRNPTESEVTTLASTPGYEDFTGIPGGVSLESIAALVNVTDQNLAHVRTEGTNLTLSYARALGYGTIEGGVDATYISKFQEQLTPETPVFSLLNTAYNPINFKARAKVALTQGGWLFAAFLNYVNAYQDIREVPAVPVASWTTMDLDLRYAIPHEMGIFAGTTISLSVINATNRNPPYVASAEPTVVPEATFDGANANSLGRFVSLEISEKY